MRCGCRSMSSLSTFSIAKAEEERWGRDRESLSLRDVGQDAMIDCLPDRVIQVPLKLFSGQIRTTASAGAVNQARGQPEPNNGRDRRQVIARIAIPDRLCHCALTCRHLLEELTRAINSIMIFPLRKSPIPAATMQRKHLTVFQAYRAESISSPF